MSAPSSVAVRRVLVITRVPPPDAAEAANLAAVFSRGKPEACGVAQFFMGLLVPALGISAVTHGNPLFITSGVIVWGPFTYFLSGSSAIAAAHQPLLIKRAVSINAIAAILALLATAVYLADACGALSSFPPPLASEKTLVTVLAAVSAAMSLLEFAVALSVATCGYSWLCSGAAQVPASIPNQLYVPDPEAPPPYQGPPCPPATPLPHEKPPDYDSVVGSGPALC